jgi:5'-deoxynucleotidase YfbR-like HD superfamily hydrolase
MAFVDRLLQAIHVHFGLPGTLPRSVAGLIKRADRIAAYFEATRLAGFGESEARRFFGAPRGIDEKLRRELIRVEPMSVGEAQKAYLEAVTRLAP